MNKILALLSCFIFVSALAGCGPQRRLESKTPEDVLHEVWDGEPPDDEVLPDFLGDQSEKSAFPESMVGVWEVVVSEYVGSKWGIKFEPDGSIKKIIHVVAGPVNIAEGGVNAERPKESYYVFVMGPCEASYIPETGMIKVKIIVDYFIFKLPAGELEGRMEDYIEGPVSEDGKIWKANWLSFGWVKDAAPPDINLTKANPELLVFTKIDIEQ